jgi:hypothetical protein
MRARKKALALLLSLVMMLSLLGGISLAGAAAEAGKAYYSPVDKLIPGVETILVADNGSSSFALTFDGSSFGAAAVKMEGSYAVIEAEHPETAEWLVDEDSYLLSSSGKYLYPSSSKGLMSYSSGRAISYTGGNITWSTSAGADYLTFNGTDFGCVRANGGTAAQIRLFAKLGYAKEAGAFTEGREYAVVTRSGDDYY